jgi:CBS domain containing-hemolysin-like protein
VTALVTAIVVTLGVSFLCSLLEAFILSTDVADIEACKKRAPRAGARLELYRTEIDMTTSAILTLNTVANTLGASVVGILSSDVFAHHAHQHYLVWAIPTALVVAILLFSEILPKNLGLAYKRQLQDILIYPLMTVRVAMWPIAIFARYTVRALLPREDAKAEEKEQEEAILLLADKSAKEGSLSTNERDMIANALSLDDIRLSQIMTPRTVVTFMQITDTVSNVSRRFKVIPFARIPVYRENIDDVVGIVRRRDIMQASAEDRDNVRIGEMMVPIPVIPETASALDALQLFLRAHQQLALVVDEFGSTAGVVTMEDVIEHLIGREIYEETDMAIDMRELARRKARRWAAPASDSSESGEPNPSDKSNEDKKRPAL